MRHSLCELYNIYIIYVYNLYKVYYYLLCRRCLLLLLDPLLRYDELHSLLSKFSQMRLIIKKF